jgi:hypothetical protein
MTAIRANSISDAPEWRGFPIHRRYTIDGVRYVEVWRGDRGVIVPLQDITDAEIASHTVNGGDR